MNTALDYWQLGCLVVVVLAWVLARHIVRKWWRGFTADVDRMMDR